MSTIIHKHQLSMHGYSSAQFPDGAIIVHVHEQSGLPCIWFKFDAHVTSKVQRDFFVSFTGEDAKHNGMIYLGTAHCDDLVCHVHELNNR